MQRFSVRYKGSPPVDMPDEDFPTTKVLGVIPCEDHRPEDSCYKKNRDVPASPDPVPLATIEPGREFAYESMLRCPNDDMIRPSTLEGAAHLIHVAHKLRISVRYLVEGETKDRVLQIKRPCIIASVRPQVLCMREN